MRSSIRTLEVRFFEGSNRLWHDVNLLSNSTLLLGRTNANLTERSVVLVLSPLVSLMVNQIVHSVSFRLLVRSFSPCGPIDITDCFNIKFASDLTHASTMHPRLETNIKRPGDEAIALSTQFSEYTQYFINKFLYHFPDSVVI